MKIKLRRFCILLALIAGVHQAFAQGTAFNYQGQLASGGAPANGSYDLTFTLYATNTDGGVIAGPVTNGAAGVTNGLFTATIDFGPGVFTGGNYWLQIAVRTNGGGSFTNLSPRQPILPVPYAIMANTASNLLGTLPAGQVSGPLPASQISGTIPLAQLPGAVLTNNASSVSLNGSFNGSHGGDGAGLTNLNPVVFGTLTPDATGTNFIIPCAINNIRYDNVTLATNINVAGITNWPGAGSLKILTAPANDVVFTCPANWIPLSTNGIVVAGGYWTELIPSNHMGWLSWKKDTGNDQANVTFTFTVSP
jgi:hypothetical protein